MKQKIIGLLTALTMLAAFPAQSFASQTAEPDAPVELMATYTYGDLMYMINSNNTVTITDCNDSVTSVDVPETIDGKTVTSIGFEAFRSCDSLTSISLPGGVTSIGRNAFGECYSLTSIYVSDSNAFYSSIDGILFNKDKSSLIQCPVGKSGEYTVPSGVTSIGDEAFSGCGGLTSINLPIGVTRIGYTAFASCTNLKSISLPDSLTSIGNWTFRYCSSLASISLPDSLTSIGNYAFDGCSSLTSISLPDGLTSIGNMAFSGCGSLVSISLPDGLTSIGNMAFSGCSSLKSINLPNGLTSIGTDAFGYCISLTNINVSDGNNSYSSVGGVLFNKDTTTLIRYPQGISGEYTIPDSVTSISYHAFSSCSNLTNISLSDSVTSIGYGAFYGCDNLKDVYYDGTELQWGKINIGSDNDPLTNATIHFNGKISFGTVGNTNSTSADAPIITYATLRCDGTEYDIFDQAVTIEEDSDIRVSIEAGADANGNEDVRVYITQGVGKDMDITGITKDIIPGRDFSAGDTIYILAVDTKTGKSSSKPTKLKVSAKNGAEWDPSSGTNGFNFKLGKDIGFTIPDSVVFPFGGMEIGFGLDSIPITFEYEHENKINIAFGIDSSNIDETTGRFKGFSFADYKETLKSNMKKSGDGYKAAKSNDKLVKELKKKYPDIKFDKVKFNVSKGIDMNTEVIGYAEMSYANGGWHFNEGFLALNAEVSYEYQGQAFIWVVPCYYEFGGEFGAGIEGTLKNMTIDDLKPVLEGYISAKVGAEIGAGIGVANVCTVGASGEGSLNIKTALHETYVKAWGEGDANLKVKVLGKTVAQKNFAHGEFTIYETGNKNALIADKNAITLQSADGIHDMIDINAIYPNEDRQYADTPTEWLGGDPVLGLMSADYTNKELQMLADNIYTEAKPQLCEIDGTTVMVIQWDNRDRADADRTMLVYSVYDEESGTWSEPIAVDDDGTADFYPCFNDGWIVWHNSKTTLDDNMTLTDIARLGEICAARWNGNGFDEPIKLTDNDILDTQPSVAKNQNGGVSVVWTTNSENDILGITGENIIMRADIVGSGQNDAEVVKSGLNAVTNISAGNVNGDFCVAYVCDTDNDLNTIDDRDIIIINSGTETQLTDNGVLDSNPVFADNMIYYYSGGNIIYSDIDGSNEGSVFNEAKTGLADSFAVNVSENGNAGIWWSKGEAGGAEIYAALRNEGVWSDEIKLTDIGNRVKYPNGILNEDGSMMIAFNNAVEQDNEIVKTDLYTISVEPSYDLEITDAYFDENTMTAYAVVRNNGELPVGGYTVSLGESNAFTGGALKAGEAAEVSVDYTIPSDMTLRKITMSVSMTDGEEYNMDNNSAEFEIGHADIEVRNAAVSEDKTIVSADISNIGYTDAAAVKVQLRDGSAEGTVIAEQMTDLSVGMSQTVTFDIDVLSMRFMDASKQLYVTAETDIEEAQTGNNDAYVLISSPSGAADYETDILNYSSENGSTVINSVAVNNTSSDVQCTVYTAVYDGSGVLKGTGSVNADIGAENDTGVDITVSCGVESGDMIKTFMWNGQEPLSKAAEITVN